MFGVYGTIKKRKIKKKEGGLGSREKVKKGFLSLITPQFSTEIEFIYFYLLNWQNIYFECFDFLLFICLGPYFD